MSDDYLMMLRERGISNLLAGSPDLDEVSVLVAPVVDGRVGTAAVFDVEDANATRVRRH